jgi:tRNA pseudouridine55 synthase
MRPTKVGHAGTLDPIASGVLLILVGQASRLTDYVHNLDKEYIGTFQWVYRARLPIPKRR